MRVFLTGGTGFIGAHLVNALLAQGSQVTCLVRSPAKAAGLGARGVRLVRGDLEARTALREGAAGADVVIHLAGLIAARTARELIAANRDGTANVLEAAAAHPPGRFLFVSSIAAAGPTVPGQPLDESAPPHPVTPYGASKLEAETLVRSATFPWTIVRPPVVYGERDRATLGIFRLANRVLVPVLGDGSQELSAIHGADLAAALVTAASAPGAIDKVYFAAHREITTSRGLALAVGRALGKTPRVIPVPAPVARVVMSVAGMIARMAGRASVLSPERADEFLAPAWTCRPDALRADTGWEATIDLATGLARTAAWYRQEGWLA